MLLGRLQLNTLLAAQRGSVKHGAAHSAAAPSYCTVWLLRWAGIEENTVEVVVKQASSFTKILQASEFAFK